MEDRNEWASEGKLNEVGKPEWILRYQESAHDGVYERMH